MYSWFSRYTKTFRLAYAMFGMEWMNVLQFAIHGITLYSIHVVCAATYSVEFLNDVERYGTSSIATDTLYFVFLRYALLGSAKDFSVCLHCAGSLHQLQLLILLLQFRCTLLLVEYVLFMHVFFFFLLFVFVFVYFFNTFFLSSIRL